MFFYKIIMLLTLENYTEKNKLGVEKRDNIAQRKQKIQDKEGIHTCQ